MKRIVRTIVITVLTCLLFIILKNEYGRLLLSNANFGMQVLIAESRDENYEGVDLFVGSSMFRMGLDIHELYGTMGGNEFLLNYNGNQPFLEYREIQYLLDSGVEIKHLYMDMYAFSAANEPWLEDERILLQTNMAFKKNVWKEMYNTGNAGVKDFWEMFVTANNDSLLTWPIYYYLINDSSYRGGNLRENPGTTKEILGTLGMPIAANRTIQGDQREYLSKIIDICNDREIPLTFLETPKYIDMAQNEEYIDLMEEYVTLLQERNVEYYLSEATYRQLSEQMGSDLSCGENHVVLFDSEEASFFTDYIHLSADGKKEYSHNLTLCIEVHGKK